MNQPIKSVSLKVQEAYQEDINKGIIRVDSQILKSAGIRPGDVVEIEGKRKTVAIAERAYNADLGLNIIRMDGITRRNAKTSIGSMVSIRSVAVKPAEKISIAPAKKGISIEANPEIFKKHMSGRAFTKGDIISVSAAMRRSKQNSMKSPFDEIFDMLDESFFSFGLGELRFIIASTEPKKENVLVTRDTIIEVLNDYVEFDEEFSVPDITYEDIGGIKDAVEKIREMVELPLRYPELFERLGIEPPKGILLYGPPGTGKTLLAKAVANETNAHFITINGPEIMSKFYGESEANLRKIFEEAEKNAPSIIFIDEIDAIAPSREEMKGDVERRVVAQLLTLMDGLKSRGKVSIIAATNLQNQIDQALRRPGRFDREIEITPPSKEGRLEILKIHTRNMPLEHFDSEIATTILLGRLDYFEDNASKKIDDLKQKQDSLKIEKTELDAEIKRNSLELKKLEQQKLESNQSIIGKILSKINFTESKISEQRFKLNSLNADFDNLENDMKKIKESILKISKIKKDLSKNKDYLHSIVDILKDHKHLILNRNDDDPRNIFSDKEFESANNKVKLMLKEMVGADLIDKSFLESVNKESIHRMLKDEVASKTHGFVGADLAALSKETAMIVLRRILPELKLGKNSEKSSEKIDENEKIPESLLEKLKITSSDFKEALKFVKPSAMREFLIEIPDIKWSDIGGLDSVKQQLKEAIEWPIKNPEKFEKLGIRAPKGILLYGPPGTGKTMLAKAVANESEANFILVKGPELLSKWVGESEKAIRKVFDKARQTSPTIIFFDEIDAIASARGIASDSKVSERVVNQLLTEMDGVEELNNVVVLASTNRPDIIDPALLRPGRFDRIILVSSPDEKTRFQILKVHTKLMPLDKDVNLEDIAKRTEYYAGADLEALSREAAIIALRENINADKVNKDHFEKALNTVRSSSNKDIEEAYASIKNKFSSAQSKKFSKESPNYFG